MISNERSTRCDGVSAPPVHATSYLVVRVQVLLLGGEGALQSNCAIRHALLLLGEVAAQVGRERVGGSAWRPLVARTHCHQPEPGNQFAQR